MVETALIIMNIKYRSRTRVSGGKPVFSSSALAYLAGCLPSTDRGGDTVQVRPRQGNVKKSIIRHRYTR